MKMIDFHRFAAIARSLGLKLTNAFDEFSPVGRRARMAPRRPVGKALRNPADPFQAERIREARVKRDRRAARRQALYDRSIRNNPCLAH